MNNITNPNSLFCFIQFMLFTSYLTVFAQYPNIKISDALGPIEPEESSITMNPLNTDHLLVGTNLDNYYYSTDGGLNWQQGVLTSPYGVNCDPCVVVGANSHYYYFHLVPDLSRVVCQKTTSLGGTWSNGTYTGVNGTKDDDKEWAAVDRSTGNLYVAWAQFDEHGSISTQDSSEIQLSRSTDDGLTWSTPVRISERNGNAAGGNWSAHCPMPAVRPDNQVYVTWMGPLGLMFDKSTDGGETWLENDINVTGFHINWLLFNIPGIQRSPGFPVINCDLSPGAYNGNIYICWTDQRSGYNDTDVWLVKSTDAGSTWSTPIRVNNDPPGKHQFFAWMTIDQANGNLYFVFYDRRNYINSQTDVYMALSEDGGETFTNFQISSSPFTPTQNDFLGDYIGVSAHNNIVRPVWPRVDDHQLSLWTAIVNNASGVDNHSREILPIDFEITSIYPNPFNPSTTIKYKLSSPGNVKLNVFDLLGRKVTTLVDEIQSAGEHRNHWHAKDISGGIYIVKLQSGNTFQTKKVVLIR